MKITVIAEGETERVFMPHLRRFLQSRLEGAAPNIDPLPCDGRIPTGDKLKRIVENLLSSGARASDAVIALTDVYTGQREFTDATDAIGKMKTWVGENERFHAHAAQYDFEAWLLPYWTDIQKLAGSNRKLPSSAPENVNHDKPPAHLLQEVFRTGKHKKRYIKPREANRILEGKDLAVSAAKCPQLKAFLNTILTLCGGQPL
jgi:hypothetical protein